MEPRPILKLIFKNLRANFLISDIYKHSTMVNAVNLSKHSSSGNDTASGCYIVLKSEIGLKMSV